MSHKSRAFILALFALLLATPVGIAHADSLDQRFSSALSSLSNHRPEAAARELRSLVALGVDDPDVYTNLGIAEAQAMRYGHAMVAFERALSLRPRDEVARRGLENASTLLARRVSERNGTQAEIAEPSALESFARSIPEPVSATLTLVSVWLACIGIALARFSKRETIRVAAITMSAFTLVLALASGTALLGRARIGETIAPAIVVGDRVPVVSAPDARAPTLTTLDEGQRVKLVEMHGSYGRITIDGRPRGWVLRSALGTY